MLTSPNILAAYLYLHLAEQMPPELPEDASREEIEQQNAWFLEPEAFTVDMDVVERFIEETQNLLRRLEDADDGLDAEEYQTMFYDAAKATYDGNKKMIRAYFAWLYLVMYGRAEGSRWGVIVVALGREEFCLTMRERFASLVFV